VSSGYRAAPGIANSRESDWIRAVALPLPAVSTVQVSEVGSQYDAGFEQS
jgi:hypothetical protein